jgi:hypothetical protein
MRRPYQRPALHRSGAASGKSVAVMTYTARFLSGRPDPSKCPSPAPGVGEGPGVRAFPRPQRGRAGVGACLHTLEAHPSSTPITCTLGARAGGSPSRMSQPQPAHTAATHPTLATPAPSGGGPGWGRVCIHWEHAPPAHSSPAHWERARHRRAWCRYHSLTRQPYMCSPFGVRQPCCRASRTCDPVRVAAVTLPLSAQWNHVSAGIPLPTSITRDAAFGVRQPCCRASRARDHGRVAAVALRATRTTGVQRISGF